jgi:hypothetical protein
MTVELFGYLIRWWAVVAVAWGTGAFLMCGLTIYQRKIQAGPDAARAAMLASLYTWPFALAAQVIAVLTDVCAWVFNPDGGPVALALWYIRSAGRNYRPRHPEAPPQPVLRKEVG